MASIFLWGASFGFFYAWVGYTMLLLCDQPLGVIDTWVGDSWIKYIFACLAWPIAIIFIGIAWWKKRRNKKGLWN